MHLETGPDTASSVVLADDHAMMRHALRNILQKNNTFEVVGEAENAEKALELVGLHKPRFLVLDIGLPGRSGLEVIYELTQKQSKTAIIVVSMYEEEATIRQAISAGARGYLPKNSPPEQLLAALQTVMQGKLFVPDQYSHLLEELEEMVHSSGKVSTRKALDPLSKLSKREREIFYLLADGSPNRVIAKKLFISPRTVETHRARVIKKLGFDSTADLIRYAIMNNLLKS